MKKIVVCFVLFFCFGHIDAQSATDTRNGLYISTTGNFRVYVVFAELTNDPVQPDLKSIRCSKDGRCSWVGFIFPPDPTNM